jgi:hypothetical protein
VSQVPKMSPATFSAASRCIPTETCEYVFNVTPIVECPRRSCHHLRMHAAAQREGRPRVP